MTNPLDWLRSKWAEVTGLPGRLEAIEARAMLVVRDTTRPMPERQAAARIVVDARDDRAQALRLLGQVRTDSADPAGLGALPWLVIVGATTAGAVAATALALLTRASSYDRELDALAARPDLTVQEIQTLREGASAHPIVQAIQSTKGLLTTALVGAAAWWALRRWGGR